MTRLRTITARTLTWLRGSRLDRDLDDEIQAHLELAARDYLRRGAAPDEARIAAARDFGGVTLAKEHCRETRGLPGLDSILQDVGYAARSLRSSPMFTAVVVVTLAVGIAANTVIFSAARAVFLRALPYPDADRLAFVSRAYPGFPQGGGNFSYPAYRDMLAQNTSFDTLAAYQDFGALALTDGATPLRIRVCYATPSYLQLLGAGTTLGRIFRAEEDRFDTADEVVVLSHRLWQTRYSAARDIVGRTIHLNQQPFVVVGVAAAQFRDALAEHEDPEPVDAWVPLGLAHTLTGMSRPNDRGGAITWGVGHLKPGVSIDQANADLSAVAKRLERLYPATDAGYGLVARPLRDQLVGEFYSPVQLLVGGSAFLLLVGCANVANILLARLLARRREFAVRAALGATAGRIARQLIVEHLLLTTFAGTLALFFAVWSISALATWTRQYLPIVVHLDVDRPIMAVSIAVSLLAGIAFSIGPLITAMRVDLRDALSQGGRHGTNRSGRTAAKSFVVAEVALSMALLVGAGLLTKSLHRLTSMDLGFDTSDLLTLRLDLRSARYATPPARAQFGRELVDRLGPLPGVRSVTLWGPSMLGRATWVMDAAPEGRSAADPRNVLTFERHSVNPGGLANLGIKILRGRDFSDHDADDAPLVAIVSQGLADTWWPGADPIGKRFFRPTDPTPITVVGVAADARHRQRFTLADAAIGIPPSGLGPQRDAYFPYSQRPNQALVVALRMAEGITGPAESLRQAVLAIDPALPVYDVALLDDRLADQERASRVLTILIAGYAAVALFLAAFGLFGILAHAVHQRTQEIGIRIALGGLPRDVLALVMRDAFSVTVIGVGSGAAGALLLSRIMTSLLFGVSSADPTVYLAISALLLVVAAVACWIPARRAIRIDPVCALRYE